MRWKIKNFTCLLPVSILVIVIKILPNSAEIDLASELSLNSKALFSGFHLKICCVEMPRELNIRRNASGDIVSQSGINAEMLDWLSTAYNFTYECVTLPPSVRPSLPNTSTTIGFYHMLEFEMCDFIAGPLVMMHARFSHFDFLNPYMATPVMMLIPKPKLSFSYLDAIWKPFQPNVWLVLFILLPVTALVLALLDYIGAADPQQKLSYLIDSYGFFVFQNVAMQGGGYLSYINRNLKMRLVIGAWCLTCFVLTTSYSSVLISFIMAPHYLPLINSVQELVESKEANPVVIKGFGTETLIAGFTDPLMQKLSQKIDQSKETRCYNATMCLEQVKNGPNVFIDGRSQLVLAMAKDSEKTGQCNAALLEDKFLLSLQVTWGIRWGDPRKELINRGILRMLDFGLMDWWDRRTAGSERCVIEGLHPRRSRLNRLSMSNLQGSFAILVGGFVLATLSWIGEMITCHAGRR